MSFFSSFSFRYVLLCVFIYLSIYLDEDEMKIGEGISEFSPPQGGLPRGLGGRICEVKNWNIYQTNIYGMLGVGTV